MRQILLVALIIMHSNISVFAITSTSTTTLSSLISISLPNSSPKPISLPPFSPIPTSILPSSPIPTSISSSSPTLILIPPSSPIPTSIPSSSPTTTSIPPSSPTPTYILLSSPTPTSTPPSSPTPTSIPSSSPLPTSIPSSSPIPISILPSSPIPTSIPPSSSISPLISSSSPTPTSTPTTSPTPTSILPSSPISTSIPSSSPIPTSILPSSPIPTSILPSSSISPLISSSSPTPTSTLTSSPTHTSIPLSSPTLTSIPPSSPIPTSIPSSPPTLTSTLTSSPTHTSIPLSSPTLTSTPPSSPLPTSIPSSSPTPTSTSPSSTTHTFILPSSPKPTSILPSSPINTLITPSSHIPVSIPPSSPVPTSLPPYSNKDIPSTTTYISGLPSTTASISITPTPTSGPKTLTYKYTNPTTDVLYTTDFSSKTTMDHTTPHTQETTAQDCIINKTETRQNMSKTSPEEDDNLKLICEFDAKGSCGNIEWRIKDYTASKNTSKITITHRDDGIRKQSAITIHSLTPSDTGKVCCRLEGEDMVFNVTVQPFPILGIFPLSTAVEEGNNVNIDCKIRNWLPSNWSNWTMTLYHDASFLLNGTNVSQLHLAFPTIRLTDGGDYLCKLCRESPHEKCFTRTSSLRVYLKTVTRCHEEIINGITWEATPVNYLSTNLCPVGYSGTSKRFCNADGRWNSVNMFECVREEIVQATDEISKLKQYGGTTEENGKKIGHLLDRIENITLPADNKHMTGGELNKTATVLNEMVGFIESDENIINVNKTKFVGIISDMLSESNKASWTQVIDNNQKTDIPSGASSLMKTVERFGSAVAKNLTSQNANFKIITPNVIIKIEKPGSPNIEFKPENLSPRTRHGISLNLLDFGNTTFTAALYKTMGVFLQTKKNGSDDVQQYLSEVLALSINGRDTNHLKTPVILTFDTDNLTRDNNLTNNIRQRCVFWNETQGWLSQGCSWVNNSCQCTHLTNFAVLISPVEVSNADVLRIISFVGCILSVLSTVTTILVYLKLWRYLKSDRSRLLLNLCAALTIVYLLFLAGIDETQDNTLCTTIAALLHYFLLSTFCLMLAEGIQLLISVTSVFHVESKLKWLLLLGWGVPLVVVGVTVGMQYNTEYHAEDYCWLSLSNGVLYSFVGPAVGVILVNIVVIFCVMKALYSSQFIRTKTEKQKIATGVRSVTVLLPVLGVTWLFGVISINDDLIVFQYLFAVTNSLQGFFIFLFYCIFNMPVRRALKKKIRRFEYRAQSSKTGSKQQVMNTRSTDSGKTKDEDRPQMEFHNPAFRYPHSFIDDNIGDPQYSVQTNRYLSLSSPYENNAVGSRYNYRSRSYMLPWQAAY